jgi:hypothetical protein
MAWFVTPAIDRLDLPDGHWLEVRRELTVGEERRAFSGVVDRVNADGSFRPNFDQIGRAEKIAYIVDWSLTDSLGKHIPFSERAVDNLRPAAWAIIEKALDKHIEAIEAAAKNRETASVSS